MELINKVLSSRYRIDEKVGEGGMACVFRAFDLKLSRVVAVKILKKEYKDIENFVDKFNIEARAAASLNHINIVGIYDVGEHQKMNYIVMEYLDGRTLKQYIAKKRQLTNEETLKIAGSIASALIAAHGNQIIHRDIKPQNVIITDDAKIKVADFGIAKTRKEGTMSRMTRSDGKTIDADADISGSIHYMAPEILKRNYSDERSDIYALGITMFEMITGVVPFDGNSDITIALKHINERLPDIKALNDEVLPSLEQIIVKCTKKNPDERYQSAIELLRDLKKIIKDPAELFIKIESDDESNLNRTKIRSSKERRELQKYNRKKNLEIKRKEKRTAFLGALTGAILAVVLAATIIFINKETIFPKEIEMPNLSEMTKEQYTKFFEDNEVTWEIVEYKYDDFLDKDYILKQSVKEGTKITKDEVVKVVLSKGKELFEVPNLVNLEYETAIALIESANLSYEIKRSFNDEVMAGIVMGQTPSKNTMLEAKGTVYLEVSLGKEEKYTVMPNVKDLTLEEGKKILTAAHLELGVVSESYSDDIPKGHIIATTLLKGEKVKEGYIVDLTISLGKEEKNVEKVIKVDNILTGEEVVCNLRVMLILDEKEKEVYNQEVTASSFENPIEIKVSGRSIGKYEVYKNDVLLFTNSIVFTEE